MFDVTFLIAHMMSISTVIRPFVCINNAVYRLDMHGVRNPSRFHINPGQWKLQIKLESEVRYWVILVISSGTAHSSMHN